MKTINEVNIIAAEHKAINAIAKARNELDALIERVTKYCVYGCVPPGVMIELQENFGGQMQECAARIGEANSVFESIIANENGATQDEIELTHDRLDYIKGETRNFLNELKRLQVLAG